MRKINIIEIVKLVIALIVGGFLGVFLLAQGISNGDLTKIILFFVICEIVGFVLWKIGKK